VLSSWRRSSHRTPYCKGLKMGSARWSFKVIFFFHSSTGINECHPVGDRMYVGTTTGNLHVYELGGASGVSMTSPMKHSPHYSEQGKARPQPG
jgi:hypothetical protein